MVGDRADGTGVAAIATLEELRERKSDGRGLIVIEDVTRAAPVAHDPACPWVTERSFETKVVQGAERNGRYWWTENMELARAALGAVRCGHELEDRGPALSIEASRGGPIASVDDWRTRAAPKGGADAWRVGASAAELAAAWFRDGDPAMPDEMAAALATHSDTAGFVPSHAVAERVTRLDDERGEHRNHDLLVVGRVGAMPVVVAVEAKAGEPFGPSSAGAYFERSGRNPGSGVRRRIAGLAAALTGERVDPLGEGRLTSRLADCAYQLLTAAVGAVVEAERQGAERAVLLVHQFVGDPATPRQRHGLASTREELDRFVRALGGGPGVRLAPGTVAGPFAVHPTPRVAGCARLYIGSCEGRAGRSEAT